MRPWSKRIVLPSLLPLFFIAACLTTACGDGSGNGKIGLDNPDSAPPADQATAATPISEQQQTAVVRAVDPEEVFQTTGSFEGWKEIVVSSEVDGVIESIPVELGQRVRKGALLTQLSQRDSRLEVEQAEAGLEVAAAQLERARLEFERKEMLFKDAAIPKSSFDIYATGLTQARANVRMAEAILAQARERLAKTRITAPRGGLISEKICSEGEFLSMASGYEILHLTVDRPLKLVFDVPERLAGRLATGHEVGATVAAYGNRVFSGVIHAVSPTASRDTRTLKIEARYDNDEGLLKSGFFASVTIRLPRPEGIFAVPRHAVARSDGGSSVTVRSEDGTEKKIPVTIYELSGTDALVTGDLTEGANLVFHRE